MNSHGFGRPSCWFGLMSFLLVEWSLVCFGVANATGSDERQLRIGSSWAGVRIARPLAQRFQDQSDENVTSVAPHDGRRVIEHLLDGRIDVGLMLRSELPSLNEKDGVTLDAYPFGKVVVCIAVNAKNPLRRLQFGELQGLFRGTITSWRDVANAGGPAAVELYSPLMSSTESFVFRNRILHGLPFSEQFFNTSQKPFRQRTTNPELFESLSESSSAIGFFLLSPDSKTDKRIRKIGIASEEGANAVYPKEATVADGSYPITDSLTFYLRADATSSARKFCEFATGPPGTEIATQFGLWHEHNLKRARFQERLADVKAGKGKPISAVGFAIRDKLTRQLTLKYVEASEAVQLRYQKEQSQTEAVQSFVDGGAELLVLEGQPTAEATSVLDAYNNLAIGKGALGVIVHPESKLTSLLWNELQQICAGGIKKWPAANGEGPVIHGYGLPMDEPVMGLYRAVGSQQSAVSGKKAAPRAVRGSPDPAQGPDRRSPDFAQDADRTSAESQETFGPTRGGVRRPAPSAVTRPALSAPLKLAKCKDTAEVILSVARDPAAIGFVDLSQMPKDDGSVMLVGLVMDDKQVLTPGVGNLPENYPLAQPYTLYLSPNAGEAAKDFFAWLSENLPEERYAGEQSADAPLSKAGTVAKQSPLKELLAKHGLLPPTKEVAEGSHGDLLAGERNTTPIEGLDLSLEEPETVKQPSDGMRSMPATIRQPRYPVQTASLQTPSGSEKSSTSAQPVAKPKTAAPPAAQSGMSEQTIALIIAGLSGTVLIGGAAVWLNHSQRRRKPARRSSSAGHAGKDDRTSKAARQRR